MAPRWLTTILVKGFGFKRLRGANLVRADLRLPGVIFGKVLRSPHSHARIESIDANRTLRHPAIVECVTKEGFDFPRYP